MPMHCVPYTYKCNSAITPDDGRTDDVNELHANPPFQLVWFKEESHDVKEGGRTTTADWTEGIVSTAAAANDIQSQPVAGKYEIYDPSGTYLVHSSSPAAAACQCPPAEWASTMFFHYFPAMQLLFCIKTHSLVANDRFYLFCSTAHRFLS